MNIGFFSAMGGGAWGGSEELWAAAAHEALAARHRVAVSMLRWRPRAAALDRLAAAGATLCERPRLQSKKLRHLASQLTRHERAFVRSRLDVLCINQGGTYDFLTSNDPRTLRRLTRQGAVPYVVVCEYNDERSVTSQPLRDRARAFLEGAVRVVFVSEHNWRLAERQLAASLPHGTVVQNPVNLRTTTPLDWPPADATARLACVARLSVRHKGQDGLLQALASERWRGRAWELRLYGSGPDEAYLRALAAWLGIADRIRFAGHVADVRAIWAEAELLVLPSYGEGTPAALMEAMLCGRPALATDVGGNAEWIQEGTTGFVAPAATARSLDETLDRAWAARPSWRTMGCAAHAAASARFDPTPGRTLLRLLEGACAGDVAAPARLG